MIAEAVLRRPAHDLAAQPQAIERAVAALEAPNAPFAGISLYPEAADRAAILCSRIVRERPLPEMNTHVAYLCMRELLRREGVVWIAQEAPGQIVETIDRLSIGMMSQWVAARVVDHAKVSRRRRTTVQVLLRLLAR